jgi:hypothetical protein
VDFGQNRPKWPFFYAKTGQQLGQNRPIWVYAVALLLHLSQARLGFPQHLGEEEKLGGIALSGSHHGSDGVLDKTGRDVSGSEAEAVLRQNMVPGRDSRIGFASTPGGGPHWFITVRLGPEGKGNEVKPFHAWT